MKNLDWPSVSSQPVLCKLTKAKWPVTYLPLTGRVSLSESPVLLCGDLFQDPCHVLSYIFCLSNGSSRGASVNTWWYLAIAICESNSTPWVRALPGYLGNSTPWAPGYSVLSHALCSWFLPASSHLVSDPGRADRSLSSEDTVCAGLALRRCHPQWHCHIGPKLFTPVILTQLRIPPCVVLKLVNTPAVRPSVWLPSLLPLSKSRVPLEPLASVLLQT